MDSMTISGACIRLGSLTRFFRIMLEIIYQLGQALTHFHEKVGILVD